MLSQAGARHLLWREVVVDFGHELITAVHTPIAWSDQRPSDEEFRKSFAATKLNASRILRFIETRRCCVQRIVLKNSEGYFSGVIMHHTPFTQHTCYGSAKLNHNLHTL